MTQCLLGDINTKAPFLKLIKKGAGEIKSATFFVGWFCDMPITSPKSSI